MGCGVTKSSEFYSKKGDKAAILIQRWYRQYVSRMEMRRRHTWNIFQSIEYAGEQDQVKLYNFLGYLMDNFTPSSSERNLISHIFRENEVCRDPEWERYFCYKNIDVPAVYSGPRLIFPITIDQAAGLVEAFKNKQQLHSRYVLQLLLETWKLLRMLPNINRISTCHSKEITICGDLHGQLEDLLLIFYKNGMPSLDTPYVFNGDFVDRGKDSIEILLILFAFMLVYPGDVHLNRGNHEDHIINLRYGFTREVLGKYKLHGKRILKLLQKIFSWLPLATVIDQKVLIVHGGLSDMTDLAVISRVDRHRILDLLWSDPMDQDGCIANEVRGCGCYWGPDMTEKFLNKHNLQLIIRSHECKQEGYEFCHNRKVLTLFSASNYYEVGSNRGAYIRLGPDLVPYFIQYQASDMTRELTLRQSVGRTERSALKALREQLFAHKTDLLSAFQEFDKENTGMISLNNWATAVGNVLHLDLPWRTLRSQLVTTTLHDMLDYQDWFQELAIKEPSTVLDTLYRHRSTLETIFRIVDTDNSGLISFEDFRQTWKLLSAFLKMEITDEAISDLVVSIDTNKDGSIDIDEFMEAFRLVDRKHLDKPKSCNASNYLE
uniref:Serine/threonine-protein phosphatase n=1 Tax=Denticeps clupeoides TaxID=299321 RepID=A0AAY4C4R6_9TELE